MNTNGDLKAVPEDRAFESPEALTASAHNEHASIDPSVSLIDGGESVLSSRRRAKNKDFQDIEETGKSLTGRSRSPLFGDHCGGSQDHVGQYNLLYALILVHYTVQQSLTLKSRFRLQENGETSP